VKAGNEPRRKWIDQALLCEEPLLVIGELQIRKQNTCLTLREGYGSKGKNQA
jgi:hypothetical protein